MLTLAWLAKSVGVVPPATRHVYGVSDKVLSMALSVLLIAAPKSKRLWTGVGTSMIAIDTLVHNFLHRAGILQRMSIERRRTLASSLPGSFSVGVTTDIAESNFQYTQP